MTSPVLEVAAGVLCDRRGRVLVARRPASAHQGGLWEFPGGKLEAGESPRQALERELDEELDIRVLQARPLIRLVHDYGDRRVVLHTWRVMRWHGIPRGCEGQPLRWVDRKTLERLSMPAADRPILRALALPPLLAITPPRVDDPGDFLAALERTLADGVSLVQFRVQGLEPPAWERLALEAWHRCKAAGAQLVPNTDPQRARALGFQAVHLNSHRLMALESPHELKGLRTSASCHDAAQLARAEALGLNFALLSPVRPTASHPGASILGWRGFAELVADRLLPVYALGGVGPGDLDAAWRHGAQGVAAIRALWNGGFRGG